MDPNETLRRIRELLTEDNGTADEWIELIELVSALDSWISAGGFLPEEWGPRGDVSVTIEITADGMVRTRPPFQPSAQLPDLPSLLRFMADHVQPEVRS